MKLFRITDIFSYAVFVWAFIVLTLNFILPTSIYFKYESLSVPSVICQGESFKVLGTYWAAFDLPSEGVDHIVTANDQKRKDRFPWSQGNYKAGHHSSSWTQVADLVEGEYKIESTELKLNILRFLPVYLNEQERPVSNKFSVVEC